MMKTSENDFNRAALQQSLQFWRGEAKPSPPQLPSSKETFVAESSKVARPTPEMLDSKQDMGPRPWRYVRWRKAHNRLPQMRKEHQESKRGNFYHRVLPDEDLIEVAEKFETYPEVLMEANHVLNPVNIATGQVLWVPRTHPIEWGNTLWSLSLKYNVPIGTIQKANGIVDPDLIYAGDVLVVPEEPDNRNAW
ncbi:hypothetical protein GOP47_0001731 [Adiantum capillus-veneris]|uniref:LysM domain-containing protein n=1 Tax=Adiantum capillus-veneris TaxID=13818 RepID=A0A9D4V992_ADICA|nr:hypothetical protein GOP47_0001731 [Adiantum capillus-veneris]